MIFQIRRVITKMLTALAVLAGLAAVAAIVLFAHGGSFQTVRTPSMTASGMPAGTAIIVVPLDADQIEAGDFIYTLSPFGDKVMHEAMGVPVEDDNQRLQLTMKGSSNHAQDSYKYDVTDGAFEVVWSMPELGAAMRSIWAPIPSTEGVIIPLPGNETAQGIPFAIPVLLVLLVWIIRPSRGTPKSSSPSGESKVSPEHETGEVLPVG